MTLLFTILLVIIQDLRYGKDNEGATEKGGTNPEIVAPLHLFIGFEENFVQSLSVFWGFFDDKKEKL